jgi:hypothetical protein
VQELLNELSECRASCERLHNKLHELEGGPSAEGSPDGET